MLQTNKEHDTKSRATNTSVAFNDSTALAWRNKMAMSD